MRTAICTTISLLAAALAAPPILAHTPPTPDTVCRPEDDTHDFVAAGSISLTVAQQERNLGQMTLIDGSLFCPPDPICIEDDEGIDLDDDGEPDIGPLGLLGCTPPLMGTDNEYEFGLGGAFLPSGHHADTFLIHPATLPVGFTVGSDGDGDGIVNGNDVDDCLEPRGFASGPTIYETDCDPGLDDGWYVFIPCFVDLHDDASVVEPNGPLLVDTDGDGFPDDVNLDYAPPIVTPPSGLFVPQVSCALTGHVG
ncbi:MAG TPA: hypothetical protein VHH36_01020 [Candidatus Thermoplasmatota archaeon]|nr:hypothetical protein [Candidatus Thermoplasmatota archaeon]